MLADKILREHSNLGSRHEELARTVVELSEAYAKDSAVANPDSAGDQLKYLAKLRYFVRQGDEALEQVCTLVLNILHMAFKCEEYQSRRCSIFVCTSDGNVGIRSGSSPIDRH